MAYYALRNTKTGRLYIDHACQMVMTSDVMKATVFPTASAAVQVRTDIKQDYPHRFEVIRLDIDYTYQVIR